MTYAKFQFSILDMSEIDVNKIDFARRRKGLLKRELAEKVGIHPQSLSRVLSGETSNPKTIKAICDALGLSMEEVYIDGEKEEVA